MMYFIGDLHFGHTNCLAYDNRPFTTIEEHDEYLIKVWNEKVKDEDTVWILGDVSWYNVTKTVEILKRLNGHKNLCIGNHDKQYLKYDEFREIFGEIHKRKELTYKGTFLVLDHHPSPCFERHYYGAVHFYAHVHMSYEWNMMKKWKYDSEALYDKPCRMYNVGCMIPEYGFAPQTFEEILKVGGDPYDT